MMKTRKVSAKSSISDEYLVNPTVSDLRRIPPTKAQRSSAGVSSSLSAATTTAAAALATIGQNAAPNLLKLEVLLLCLKKSCNMTMLN